MIEVSALLFTLLIEGAGLLIIILVVWLILTVRKKNKDKAAAKTLVSSIKSNSEERISRITELLSKTGLQGEALKVDVKKLDRLEKDFYTQLIRLYLKRDSDVFANIDSSFEQVLEQYKNKANESFSAGNSSEAEEHFQAQLETLVEEKEAISIELQITKTTMANMMAEFNTMFNGGNETVQSSKEALQTSVAQVKNEQTAELEDDIEVATAPVSIGESMEDLGGVSFSVAKEPEPSAAQKTSKKSDDFGAIVSSGDVDDLLDGIDLSKEIDEV